MNTPLRFRLALPVVFQILTSPGWAAPPVDVPTEVKGDPGAFVTIRGKTEGKSVRFVPIDTGLNVFPPDLLTDKKATVVVGLKPGRYRVLVYSAIGDDPTDPAIVTVVIGSPPPPGPDPDPSPDPDPPPPAPDGFRVIFVYETAAPLSPNMQRVMFGQPVTEYLNTKSKGWRRWDKDVDATNEKDSDIKALWKAARPKVTVVPCVIVASGNKAEILPFPASEEEALKLFKKFGG